MIPIVLVSIYSSLPLLLKGYTWIPGDDYADYLNQLRKFPDFIRYYGVIPIKYLPLDVLTSLKLYYYSTPIFVFIGLYYTLKDYSWWTPTLAWIMLFFLTPVILQDMEAGTFIGVVGFYFTFLILFKLSLKTNNPYVSTIILGAGILFHTITGIFLAIAYLTSRKPSLKNWLPLLIPIVIGAIWGIFFGASTINLTRFLNYTYTEQMTPILFLKHYLGVSTLMLLTLGILMVYNVFRFRLTKDRFVWGLLGLVPTFIFFSFTPLHLNSDRFSKYLVGTLVILTVIGISKALEEVKLKYPRAKTLLYGSTVSIVLLLLWNTATAQFNFWMGLGIYVYPILLQQTT